MGGCFQYLVFLGHIFAPGRFIWVRDGGCSVYPHQNIFQHVVKVQRNKSNCSPLDMTDSFHWQKGRNLLRDHGVPQVYSLLYTLVSVLRIPWVGWGPRATETQMREVSKNAGKALQQTLAKVPWILLWIKICSSAWTLDPLQLRGPLGDRADRVLRKGLDLFYFYLIIL